jgi:drug/metabolite transporter (DMT)-like permease
LAGVIILREHFGWPQAIGSVIIIASAYGVNKSGKPSKEAA